MWNSPLSVCLRVGFWYQCIWFGSWGPTLILSNNQSRATLWVLETCLIVGLLPFYDHLEHCFVVFIASLREEFAFEETKSTFFRSSIFPEINLRRVRGVDRSPCSVWFWFVFPRAAAIRSHKSSAPIPSNLNILHPMKWFLILLNCAKLKFVSYTSNWCMTSKNAQCSTRSRFWILKISSKIWVLKQSQSALFGSISHMTILSVFTCVMNVWNQSIQAFVTCFGPLSDWSCKFVHWPLNLPCISISEQFESTLLTILPRISILLLGSDGRQGMELILCRVVESSCWPTHNIVPHISGHDLPHHKTMKKYEDFWGMEVFQFLPLKFAIQTWLCNCPEYLCLFGIVFECSPSIHDQRKMLVLPNRLLCWVVSTSDWDFVSFQPILCQPHTQIRIILFHDEQISIPNWKLSPNRAATGFSQIAFPTMVLPTDDRTNSFQEERLGLPYWTMI